MLQNAYFLAKIGADTAENEQHFAEILPTDALGAIQTPVDPVDPGAAALEGGTRGPAPPAAARRRPG